jgi:serine/threonine protein kinase
MDLLFAQYVQQTTPHGRAACCAGFVTHLRTLICGGGANLQYEPLVDIVLLSHLVHVSTDCGAIVMLAFDRVCDRFVVVKQYLHEDGAWCLPPHVLRQLQTSMKLYTFQQSKSQCLQPCIDVQITENTTHMMFPFYPLTFEALFGLNREPPEAFVCEKAVELLQAVTELHKAEIAHRDIKGPNICFNKRGRLVLIDFDSSVTNNLHQRKTVPICTLQTRAPEQIRMEITADMKENRYDAQAGDWWSTGCVIAQMFLGKPLFTIRDENWSLREFYEDISTFCAHLSDYRNSEHNLVKALRRRVSTDIMMLLCGLLSLFPEKRLPQVVLFLSKQEASLVD